ncbi:MAG: DUF1573 domain-containing protein [Planctomycetia bacterium]|nr:DUF1573 domain-containing protein [Planctomycetia bacterium]
MSRRIWVAGLLFLAAAVATGAVWWQSGQKQSAKPDPSQPVIDCPREIDLGTVEIHRTVEGVLPITNTGGQPLTIRDITTSCGCLGARLLPNREELKSSATVTIPPGGRVEIVFPLLVSGVHGVKTGHLIRFATDAPETPTVEVRLTFTPSARYFADPAAISLGDIAQDNSPPLTTIGLFTTDDREAPAVKLVTSTDPERVKITFVPESPGSPVVPAEATPGSRRFGQVKVELGALRAGESVNAQVQVYVDGQVEPILAVPVSARVMVPVELLPPVLYLPRMSSSGPVYSGVVLCRATGTDGLRLQIDAVPPGLSVSVEDSPNNPGLLRVVVEGDPKIAVRESVIPLTARVGGREYQLSLRVVIESR